jgi:hypothetical protein
MQKNFYLLLVLISCSLVSRAQISKGSILLGGSLQFNAQNNNNGQPSPEKSSGSNFGFSPSIGKAIKDNLIAGIDLTYGHSQATDNQNGGPSVSSSNDNYGIGVFLRQYMPLGKGFSFFTQEGIGGVYFQVKSEDAVTDKGYQLSANFSPGLAYNVTRRLQLEIGFLNFFFANYSHSKALNGSGGDDVTNTFSAGTNLTGNFQQLQFSCQFLLGH